MAGYKLLKSVAHDIGHSFCSTLNYFEGDYVLGHLLRIARSSGSATFTVDLLSRNVEPKEFLIPSVAQSLAHYRDWFKHQVATRVSSQRVVDKARMTIAFDLKTTRFYEHDPRYRESPYKCVVEIIDDRGKKYEARISGWWFPEMRDLTA